MTGSLPATILVMSTETEAEDELAGAERRLVGESTSLIQRINEFDPFLAPQLIVIGTLALDLLLPDKLTIGPSWLLPSFEGLLVVVLVVTVPRPRIRYSTIRRRVALTVIGLVSLVNGVSLVLLCHHLLTGGKSNGKELILSGVVLWVTNVLLFGLWYWQLDQGGPLARREPSPRFPDFMFVQMTDERWAPPNWTPGLIDYLYLSFTNASAFSPTDTMPLTRLAKLLMTTQAIIALLTIALVVSRAVNILS